MNTEFAPTPFFYIFIGFLVGLILGWLIGFFDSNNRSAKKIQSAEANAAIAMKEAENKIAEANRILEERETAASDDPGVLRLKIQSGRYALEMDGIPVQGALPPEGKKRLIELLTAIRPYLEGETSAPAAAAPKPPVSAPTPKPIPAPTPKPAAASTPPSPSSFAPEEELAAPQKPLINPADKKAMASLSMIGQIDAVLQWRLAASPLAKRGIRVAEAPGGGVRVEVGLEKFEAVDDVPDPEIKAFIKAAIAEWEKKFTPGL